MSPGPPAEILERVEGFGLYNFSISPVFRPASVDELRDVLARCRGRGERPVFRAPAAPTATAATNPSGPVVEMTALKESGALDEATGVVRAGAGLTLGDLWSVSIPRGFWPPVVTGTMNVTLGGAVADERPRQERLAAGHDRGARRGAVGAPPGRAGRGDREGRPALDGVIGNWRSEEPVVEVALHLKRVASGWLDVEAFATPDLASTLAALDGAKESWEYLVGWMDCWARGRGLGRSVVHLANEHAVPADEGRRALASTEQVADIRTGPLPTPLLLSSG